MEQYIIALLALTLMEIVLGIDNIVFIAILTDRLPAEQRSRARRLGLAIALVARIALLCGISWVMTLTAPVFSWTALGIPESWFEVLVAEPVAAHESAASSEQSIAAGAAHTNADTTASDAHIDEINTVSGRDLILLLGGLFLIVKTVKEIHGLMEGSHEHDTGPATATFSSVLVQIGLLDIVFSLDSVITAVGMVDNLTVMITAVIIAVGVMIMFSDRVSNFVSRHPTLKMLALSFLMLIGVMLVAEGFGTHVNKGYIYFAMAFSLIVEMLNMRSRSHPVLAADSAQ